MARRPKAPKEKKAKRVTVKLVREKNGDHYSAPYEIMHLALERWHPDLIAGGAKIAVAWQLDMREDADGRVKYGATKRRGDLDREMDKFDIVLLVNKKIWDSAHAEQQLAMMDHRLLCVAVSKDKNGEPKVDEEGRTVYRIRRPEVNAFKEELLRHGAWTTVLEEALHATAHAAKTSRPLLDRLEKAYENSDGDEGVAADECVPVRSPKKKAAAKQKKEAK